MMVFVRRDPATQKILAIFANPQPQEDGSCLTDPTPLDDNDPEVLGFGRPSGNAAIDARIEMLYAEKEVTRGFTELAWAIAQIRDIQNAQIDALVAKIRTLTNDQTFDVPRVPDLKKNKGMQDSKALIDQTAVLRAQKT